MNYTDQLRQYWWLNIERGAKGKRKHFSAESVQTPTLNLLPMEYSQLAGALGQSLLDPTSLNRPAGAKILVSLGRLAESGGGTVPRQHYLLALLKSDETWLG